MIEDRRHLNEVMLEAIRVAKQRGLEDYIDVTPVKEQIPPGDPATTADEQGVAVRTVSAGDPVVEET